MLALVGGVAGWSLYARLDSAAIAVGQVVVNSHRKTVQHLEGGILRVLLVKEGDVVKVGQAVALLDSTQSDAQLGQLESQHVGVLAKLARLRAEQQDWRGFQFPEDLLGRGRDAIVADALQTQRKLFDTRWRAFDSSAEVIGKRIEQLKEQIAAAESQLVTVSRRLQLTEEEERSVSYLLELGYERRPRLLELQKAIEELKGRASDLRGTVAQARQGIASAQAEKANLGDTRQADIARELEEARAFEVDLDDRIRAARDVRQRREITSPQDGVVVDLRLITPGGVLLPGQPLMDIVPLEDELIVEARVLPDDIEAVHSGLSAMVYLLAYKSATTPPIEGEVTYVSADMLTDERTGDSYFLSRVRLAPESLAQARDAVPSPGMPATVLIVTGKRRAIDYFLEPLTQRMRGAFRES
jgi:HlyD family secretion protein